MLEGLRAPSALVVSWNSVGNVGTSLNAAPPVAGGP